MSYLSKCPRCGTRAYEALSSYSHCVECLYYEDHHLDIERCAHDAKRIEREVAEENENERDENQLPDAA